MTTFYLVRHGETKWNKEHRLQGWLDSPLTEDGIMHAKKLGKRLFDMDFTAVYSSTSGRAKDTAHYIFENRDIPINYHDDLREIHLGDWQGKRIDDIMQEDRHAYANYIDFPAEYRATHTESFGEVTERAFSFLQKIAKTDPDGTVLIISHGVTITCILNALLERSIASLWELPILSDTSVSVVEVSNDKWQVKDVGCIQHLL